VQDGKFNLLRGRGLMAQSRKSKTSIGSPDGAAELLRRVRKSKKKAKKAKKAAKK
jgi:hypothetical protein